MPERALLLSLATALPPHLLWQRDVAAKAHAVFGPYFEDFERLAGMFTTSGIEKRHGVKPLDWYLDPRGWPERTQAYLEGAEALFIEASTAALAQAGLTGADVDTVVTLSSTGIATPSLDGAGVRPHGLSRRRAARAGLRPRLRRRRLRPDHRGPARRAAARIDRAPRRTRTVHARLPARRLQGREPRRDGAVRRRRRGLPAAGRGTAAWRGSRAAPSTTGPTRSTSWDGASIRRALASSSPGPCRPSSRSGSGRRSTACSSGSGSRARLSAASSAIPGAPRSSPRSSARPFGCFRPPSAAYRRRQCSTLVKLQNAGSTGLLIRCR